MILGTISTSRADESALLVLREIAKEADHIVRHYVGWLEGGRIFDQTLLWIRERDIEAAVIHGDRWDALLAATAATVAGVPIIHIGGGDVTDGSYDDRMRDAISKLACAHLAGSQKAYNRLLDEHLVRPSDYVLCVGELALEWLASAELLSEGETERALGLVRSGYVLVNWQPETAAADPNAGLRAILAALGLGDAQIVFIKPGNDRGSEEALDIIQQWRLFDRNAGHDFMHDSLSRQTYASAMKWASVMVGNSSSGLIEAPMFGTPFVMVGNRQRGRPMSSNTCPAQSVSSIAHLVSGFSTIPFPRERATLNPYWSPNCRALVREALAGIERALKHEPASASAV